MPDDRATQTLAAVGRAHGATAADSTVQQVRAGFNAMLEGVQREAARQIRQEGAENVDISVVRFPPEAQE